MNFSLIVGGLVVVAACLFVLAVAVALFSQRLIPSHVPNWQAEVFPMCARLQQDYQGRVAKYADFEAWASRTHVSVAFHAPVDGHSGDSQVFGSRLRLSFSPVATSRRAALSPTSR